MLRSNSLRVPSAIVGLLGAVLCAMVFAGCEKDTRDSDIVNVKVAEVSELVKDAEGNPTALLLIDPRPQTEFEEGHIPGARNLLLTRFDGEKGAIREFRPSAKRSCTARILPAPLHARSSNACSRWSTKTFASLPVG